MPNAFLYSSTYLNLTYSWYIFSLSVEVADFNFGETSSVDLEYKTFYRRLVDSIRDALPRRGYSVDVNETEDSSLRYGTMT